MLMCKDSIITNILFILIFLFFPISANGGEALRMNGDTLIVGKDIINAWLDLVDGAEETILIATYKFTSRTALNELIEAKERGVEVKMIFDGAAAAKKNSLVDKAINAGFEVRKWPSGEAGKMHVKLYIFDNRIMVSGSFNLTRSAETENTELMFRTDDKRALEDALAAWNSLYEIAR